ncbi:MAG: carboxyvinyl-carboxyphosphonate phosphorylmutase [Rhodospirillaceae bacterium]|nr:carboxyvinyl-carboxyphosphonate phosphorylmutase [Rhodospirillaceae bacterium]HAA93979.1 carboxyvinyl-carboxyphosphonate phosphorylmutase [Rhodospirillaceae bacterium]
MAETKSKGRRLKDLIEAPEILVSPGIFDGYSARLVESRGYKSGAISGAGLSECHTGYPDRGLMGLDENLANCRKIADCCDLLLHADADTGYGNAVNVYFVTQAFEKAGVAAVMFEDQTWPKRCGHMVGKSVIEAEEMVEKIHAASDAKKDPDFIIKSRTDARGPLGLEEAIRRLNLYAEAGADLLFADALLSEEDIRTVAANVDKPLTVNMGLGIRARSTTPLIPPKKLQDMGVAAVSYPRLLTTSAVRGMINGLDAFEAMIEANEPSDRPDLCVNFEELNSMLDVEFLDELEERYAVGGDKRAAE